MRRGILVRDWDISTWPWLPTRWNWEVVAQPLATLGAGAFAIGAAGIALHNGNKDREASENRHREEVDLNKEQKLRERFTDIIKLLSNSEDLMKREAGAYALAALSNDWGAFHRDDKEKAQREQQVCLNILIGQLKDKLSDDTNDPLIQFKQRIQGIIIQNFFTRNTQETSTFEASTDFELDFRDCSLHYPIFKKCKFNNNISFANATLHGESDFSESIFHKVVNFSNCTFKEYATFKDSRFLDLSFFKESHFGDVAQFDNTVFRQNASFYSADFSDEAGFAEARFEDGAYFSNSKFTNEADFSQSTFLGALTLSGSRFQDVAYFNEARFRRNPSLRSAEFSSPPDFSDTIFQQKKFDKLKEITSLTDGIKFGIDVD